MNCEAQVTQILTPLPLGSRVGIQPVAFELSLLKHARYLFKRGPADGTQMRRNYLASVGGWYTFPRLRQSSRSANIR